MNLLEMRNRIVGRIWFQDTNRDGRRVLVPHMDRYNSRSLEEFYTAHDQYEAACNSYSEFHRTYSVERGRLSYDRAHEIESLIPRQIGDIDGLFSPLDAHGTNYYCLLRHAKNETAQYEYRLLELIRPISENPDNIDLHSDIGSNLPLEMFEAHTAPARLFSILRNLMQYESMAEFVRDNFTNFEYTRTERDGTIFCEAFGANARRLPRSRGHQYHIPSIQRMRRMLPATMSVDMFSPSGGWPKNETIALLRDMLYENCSVQTALQSYYVEADENGWIPMGD